jgi:MFS family permease
LRVLRHRRFRALWLGVTVSAGGTWLRQLAASVLMLEQTGSAAMVGLLNFTAFLPLVFLSVVGGHAVDQLSSRTVLIRAQALSAAISAGLAVAALAGRASPPVLLAGVGLLGASYAFTKPAAQALIPGLVPRQALAEAIAVNSLAFTLGLAVGPAVGSVVLRLAGPAAAFALDAVSFLPLLVIAVGLPRSARRRGGSAGRSIAEAFRFVARRRMLLVLLSAMACSTVAIEVVKTLMPVFVHQRLGLLPASAGLLIGVFGLGSLVGAVLAPWLERRLGPVTLTTSSAVLGVAVVAFANLRAALLGVGLLLFAGMAFMVATVLITAAFFRVVPEALRGRVFAIHALSFLGVSPFAALVSGALAEAVGVRLAVTITGCFALLGALIVGQHGGLEDS